MINMNEQEKQNEKLQQLQADLWKSYCTVIAVSLGWTLREVYRCFEINGINSVSLFKAKVLSLLTPEQQKELASMERSI